VSGNATHRLPEVELSPQLIRCWCGGHGGGGGGDGGGGGGDGTGPRASVTVSSTPPIVTIAVTSPAASVETITKEGAVLFPPPSVCLAGRDRVHG
jgi:hypothetical protein